MFENLKAAIAAKVTLSNIKGPAPVAEHRAWSCTILFYGAIVGSAAGSDQNEFTVKLNPGLQTQIIEALNAKGFTLDLLKIPPNAIQPDTEDNFMRLAVAQIADEMDVVKDLKVAALTQTLLVLDSSPEKVEVFAVPFTQAVKGELQAKYGADHVEILNETIARL